ncbi:9121_t:CDS:2 [Funneliformis geosporum]|uniref:9121_t:CDS:1 n=1 Tax=Funneliformis geosporum TaxID=1117311 RepID=A0A9W4SBX7_9GLOM|nr:9121_t:CDS:2 [Funneliformis geosporum]
MSLHINNIIDYTLPPLIEGSENESYSVFGQCLDCGKEKVSDGWCKDFEQFDLIENTNKIGSFCTIFSAIWMEGPRRIWDEKADQRIRNGPKRVALKRLNNSQNICEICEDYLNQVTSRKSIIIAKRTFLQRAFEEKLLPPEFKIQKHIENKTLYSYLDEIQGNNNWREIVEILWGISGRLEYIHDNGSIHGNIHGGIILVGDEQDPLSNNSRFSEINPSINKKTIYGVLPYVAPEVLRGNPITKASDFYSFGIVMWALSAGVRPWCNRPHDFKLASEICNGIRPDIIDGTPYDYVKLMTQCWHSDISKRPTASEIYDLLGIWITACDEPDQSELSDQFDLAEKKTFSNLEIYGFHLKRIHNEAFYTSRLLCFPELHKNDERL